MYGDGGNKLCKNTGDKSVLLEALNDMGCTFSKGELSRIIDREFFDDENPLSVTLVDAAVMRMVLWEQGTVDEVSLQRARKEVIREVIRRIRDRET